MTATVTKGIGSGRSFSTPPLWEAGKPDNLVTAEKSAATTFLTGTFAQGDALTFVGSGATGKLIDTDSTGPGTGTYIIYGLLSGNPATSDVVTGPGGTPATCVLSSGTPTTTGVIWRGEQYDTFSLSATFTVSGSTTDTGNYAELTAAAGLSIQDVFVAGTDAYDYNTSLGVGMTNSVADTAFAFAENNFHLNRLQFQSTVGASGAASSEFRNGTLQIVHDNIFVTDNTNNFYGVAFKSGELVNNLIIFRGGYYGLLLGYPGVTALVANTIVRPSDAGAGEAGSRGVSNNDSGSTNVTATDNNCFGPWSSGFVGTFNAASDYNATDKASAPGANSVLNLTYANQFVTVTNTGRDFTPKTGHGLQAGVRAQTYTNDLDGLKRARSTTTPTIGSMEQIAAGGGTPLFRVPLLNGLGSGGPLFNNPLG